MTVVHTQGPYLKQLCRHDGKLVSLSMRIGLHPDWIMEYTPGEWVEPSKGLLFVSLYNSEVYFYSDYWRTHEAWLCEVDGISELRWMADTTFLDISDKLHRFWDRPSTSKGNIHLCDCEFLVARVKLVEKVPVAQHKPFDSRGWPYQKAVANA